MPHHFSLYDRIRKEYLRPTLEYMFTYCCFFPILLIAGLCKMFLYCFHSLTEYTFYRGSRYDIFFPAIYDIHGIRHSALVFFKFRVQLFFQQFFIDIISFDQYCVWIGNFQPEFEWLLFVGLSFYLPDFSQTFLTFVFPFIAPVLSSFRCCQIIFTSPDTGQFYLSASIRHISAQQNFLSVQCCQKFLHQFIFIFFRF